MNGRSGQPWPQDPQEFSKFIDLVQSLKVGRYLEIGCRNGDTFHEVMKASPRAFGVAVDLPWRPVCGEYLAACVSEHNAVLIQGNSRDEKVVKRVKKLGPYDLVLIDGDHTYEGVTTDCGNYGKLAPVIVFHDIDSPDDNISDGKPVGVPQFWRSLRFGQKDLHYTEYVTPGSDMGFGVVFRP